MGRVLRYIDVISIWSGKLCSWIVLPLTAIVAYDVILRKLYRSTLWVYDTSLWLYSAMFLIGCTWVLKEHAHIRVDVIYEKYSPRAKAIFEVCTYLMLFFPVIVMLFVSGSSYAWESFRDNEISINSPWNPIIWPFKAIAPVAWLLLLLQGISDFIKELKKCFKEGE
jgi:TRAP-type mannitol/chloroaromatic compound transport system permease small subunit